MKCTFCQKSGPDCRCDAPIFFLPVPADKVRTVQHRRPIVLTQRGHRTVRLLSTRGGTRYAR